MTKYRVEIDEQKTIRWYKWETDEHHREDGPALEYANGDKVWFLNGECHREDGPACEGANGTKKWFLNGECHREDGPACEWSDESKSWYLNGKLLSEKQWKAKVNKDDCEGKVVEIDGVEYELRKSK